MDQRGAIPEAISAPPYPISRVASLNAGFGFKSVGEADLLRDMFAPNFHDVAPE